MNWDVRAQVQIHGDFLFIFFEVSISNEIDSKAMLGFIVLQQMLSTEHSKSPMLSTVDSYYNIILSAVYNR